MKEGEAEIDPIAYYYRRLKSPLDPSSVLRAVSFCRSRRHVTTTRYV